MTGDNEFVRSFEYLRVWQDAMVLTKHVYALCKQLPKEEMYGLASQMKRAAVSIPSNIAEGSERNGTKELIQFLFVARGSLAELQTQLLLGKQLGFYSDVEEVFTVSKKLSRGLASLIKSLQNKSPATCHPTLVTTE